jgi:hypothetical protein
MGHRDLVHLDCERGIFRATAQGSRRSELPNEGKISWTKCWPDLGHAPEIKSLPSLTRGTRVAE